MRFLFSLFETFGSYAWVLNAFVVVVASWLCYKLINLLLRILHGAFCPSQHWRLAICVKSVNKPISFLIFAFCLIAIISLFNENTDFVKWFSEERGVKISVAVFVAWCLIRFVLLIQEHLMYHSVKNYDKTSVLAFGQIAIALTIVLSVLIILQFLGVNFTGLLAFGGFSGIAIGFAAKDLLANFFGAIMIYMDKPFKVGDWIRSPDREIEGEVESIGWRQTKIITFEKRPIYVPNSLFSTVVVENPSRMTHRRLNEVIGIRHEDLNKASDIIDDIKDFLIDHAKVDNSQSLVVGVVKINPSSVDIMIYCFTLTTTLFDFSQVRQEILLGAGNVIDKYDAKLANPTMQITTPSREFLTKENDV